MPVGPYKDFDACVLAQKKKGKSDESAKSICGEIEKKTNQGLNVDEDGHIIVQENVNFKIEATLDKTEEVIEE